MVALGPTESSAANSSANGLPDRLLVGNCFRDRCADDRQSSGNRLWSADDPDQCAGLCGFHCMEKQTEVVPTIYG